MGNATLADIAEYHNDVLASLRLYFSVGRRPGEIAPELTARIEETDLRSAFALLTRLEAAFRMDYEYRCEKKKKDDLSRALREIYKRHGIMASLSNEIFEAWKQNSTGTGQIIGDLRGAFRYRDWFAHGRYREPKLGRKYDYSYVFLLAENVLNAFPFYQRD